MDKFVVKNRNDGNYAGQYLTSEHYDYLFNQEVEVRGPDGELVFILLKNRIDLKMLRESWAIIKKINMKSSNRGTASGIKMKPRRRRDGTLSKTLVAPKGMEVISGVIGYADRYPRLPYCRSCSWNQSHPKSWNKLLPLFKKVSDLHCDNEKLGVELQKDYISKTHKDFVIKDTIYTSVTVNKNFRCAAHKDKGNLEEGTASMLYLSQGKFKGGHLVFPEYRVAAEMHSGDLIIFHNMKAFHGNTKIIGLSKDYQRCTVVFYYKKGMINCGSIEDELKRAQSGIRTNK